MYLAIRQGRADEAKDIKQMHSVKTADEEE
jgi:hypothetical protein